MAIVVILTVAAIALVLSGEAMATITGVQPPASGDWVIDEDTTVLAETITLKGNLNVEPGYKLIVRNSAITFDCTFAGEWGFYVLANATHDGDIDLSEATFKAKTEANGWQFVISGSAYIHDSVKMYSIQNGFIILGDDVEIIETDATTLGQSCIAIDSCDPTLGPDLVVSGTYETSAWDPAKRESRPNPGVAIGIFGSLGNLASPTIDGVKINLFMRDEWEGTVSTSTSCYEYFYLYGLYASFGDLDSIANINISLDYEISANITDAYASSTYLYFYNRQYIYGVYLTDGTYLDSFDNVEISHITAHTDAWQSGGDTSYFRNYRYLYGVYNNIDSTGYVPSTWGGVAIRDFTMTYDNHGDFSYTYNYQYGYGVYWYPSILATVSPDMTVEEISLDGLVLERFFYFAERGEFTIYNCEASNCTFSSYFLYLSSWNYPVTVEESTLINNTFNSYFVYCYHWDGQLNFIGNNISYNTFSSLMFYDYQTSSDYDGDFLFEDNVFIENEFRSYWSQHVGNTSPYTYGYGDWTFDGNLFLNNTFLTYFLYHYYYGYGDYTFENNNFTGNRFANYFLYMYYFYEGDLTFDDNVFERNTVGIYMFYFYGYNDYDSDIYFQRNYIANNTFSSSYGLGYLSYPRGDFLFTDNHLFGNRFGSSYGTYTYLYYTTGKIDFSRNIIESNTFTSYGFMLYYMGMQTNDVTFEYNDIINNSGSSSYEYYAVIQIYYLYKSLEVSNNYIAGNKRTAICFMYMYGDTSGGPNSNYNLYLEHNEIVDNQARGIYFYNGYYAFNVFIRYNYGTGNQMYPISMESTSYSYRGPLLLLVESNNFQDNPGGGLYLRPYFFDPRYTYDYRNPYQTVSVKNNILRNNGAGGWALAIVDFHKKPTMKSNDLTGSAMGTYLELTKSPFNREEVNLIYRDVEVDGGVNGTTAFGFGDINVEFYDCTFINYTEAIYAKDCLVNVWHCNIPEASGKTDGTGRIYVWNWLEIWINWANATGVDSGVSVDRATVALRGANNKYFGGKVTDVEGKLEPMLINPWTCSNGKMDAWAPFEITVMSNGISAALTQHVVGDLIAPEPALLLLVDDSPPAPSIAFPQDGMLVGDRDVTIEGFLFEVGSGVDVFEGRNDMMAEDEWVPIAPYVIWEHTFPEMSEGYHDLMVRSSDRAGNWNMTNITVLIDFTIPELTVRMLYVDGVPIEKNETRGGYFVSVREIIVNGTYSDNIAHVGDVRIRFNGVYEYIFPSQWGKINKRITLVEGFNTIIVDATDLAGNRITEELVIIRDIHAPSVYVLTPIQNEETANPECTVTGKSEPEVTVKLKIESSAGTKDYSTMTDDEGGFEIIVELFEGPQKILIDAIDPAGNANKTFRDVVLDTIPPDFVINNPSETETVTALTKFDILCTMLPGSLNARTYIGGQEVPNEGVVRRTIVLQEGANHIEILAIDPVGNERSKTVTIVRDTVQPVMDVLEPTANYMLTNKNMVQFAGTIEGSDPAGGVFIEHKTIDYPARIVSGDWVEFGNWEYTLELGPTDLEQEIRVWATDFAGNVVYWEVYVVYDEIPPSLRLDDQPEETDSSILLVNGTTEEDILEVFFQGVSFPVTNGVFSLAWPLNEGTNELEVNVYDLAGNSATDTISITYLPKKVDGGGGGGGVNEDNWTELWGWVILIAAVTLIATAVVVSTRRPERR